jgi:amino acid transporter
MTHQSGEERLYREWKYPSIPLTILIFSFIGMLAIAYSAAFDPLMGLGIFIVCGLITLLGAWNYSPRLEIRTTEQGALLIAGEAQLPAKFIQNPQYFDAETVTAMRRGSSFDSAFWMVKGNSAAIGFENTDPTDPHELWLIATRNPDNFKNALVLARSHST